MFLLGNRIKKKLLVTAATFTVRSVPKSRHTEANTHVGKAGLEKSFFSIALKHGFARPDRLEGFSSTVRFGKNTSNRKFRSPTNAGYYRS